MASTNDRLFVDTNLLVYAHQATGEAKSGVARKIIEHLWNSSRGATSIQVLMEFHSVATRKAAPPVSVSESWMRVMPYLAWRPIPSTRETLEAAQVIQETHRLALWDAHIIAAAEVAGVRWVLSEDMGHDTEYGSVTVFNPFKASRARLGEIGLELG